MSILSRLEYVHNEIKFSSELTKINYLLSSITPTTLEEMVTNNVLETIYKANPHAFSNTQYMYLYTSADIKIGDPTIKIKLVDGKYVVTQDNSRMLQRVLNPKPVKVVNQQTTAERITNKGPVKNKEKYVPKAQRSEPVIKFKKEKKVPLYKERAKAKYVPPMNVDFVNEKIIQVQQSPLGSHDTDQPGLSSPQTQPHP